MLFIDFISLRLCPNFIFKLDFSEFLVVVVCELKRHSGTRAQMYYGLQFCVNVLIKFALSFFYQSWDWLFCMLCGNRKSHLIVDSDNQDVSVYIYTQCRRGIQDFRLLRHKSSRLVSIFLFFNRILETLFLDMVV